MTFRGASRIVIIFTRVRFKKMVRGDFDKGSLKVVFGGSQKSTLGTLVKIMAILDRPLHVDAWVFLHFG